MMAVEEKKEFVTFSPHLSARDESANYWMRQVTVRLRREVSWCWHERGRDAFDGNAQARASLLPPFVEKSPPVLDMSRFWEEKQRFYMTDTAARYLTEQLDAERPQSAGAQEETMRGSFGWVVAELELNDVATFVLALAMTTAFDASMGSVIAACLNDQSKIHPNLALAQKLWDEPEEVLSVADLSHPLFRYGLLKHSAERAPHYAETEWEAPLAVPTLVAQQLLFPETPLPESLAPVVLKAEDEDAELTETARLVAHRLGAREAETLRIVPVLGAKGSARRETAARIARASGRSLVEFKGDPALLDSQHYLNSLATLCWLKDACLFLDGERSRSRNTGGDKHHGASLTLSSPAIPAIHFLSVAERSQIASLPSNLLLPVVPVPSLTYHERVALLHKSLGARAEGLDKVIAESARRFRYERETVEAICEGLRALPGTIGEDDFVAACRAELDTDIGELASRVTPRFEGVELVLPPKQHHQFEEHVKAMRALTEVHYGWGTGRVWNESGISVLFAGPPGTGKTMAAEVLASRLNLPMYRIDLSQVVNKYIGETEKNLKRLFDAADISDMILFFDEADSLFGRRTEVSDAHDRYANLEISYLLERMERFKGLAILATNRKKDLDEAFLRRLRYVIDFPLPDAAERKRIWRQVIPASADTSELDFDFLARQFQLAGGNIRSIAFNACLQCAAGGDAQAERRLTMREVIIAVKREYDKLNRALSLEQFGSYAGVVEGLERE